MFLIDSYYICIYFVKLYIKFALSVINTACNYIFKMHSTDAYYCIMLIVEFVKAINW